MIKFTQLIQWKIVRPTNAASLTLSAWPWRYGPDMMPYLYVAVGVSTRSLLVLDFSRGEEKGKGGVHPSLPKAWSVATFS